MNTYNVYNIFIYVYPYISILSIYYYLLRTIHKFGFGTYHKITK